VIERGPTHVIDTRAVRTILSTIPSDWLVRNLEERDYGIDLTIEMFDGKNPTGRIALIQVKGRETSFPNRVSISFPVKTIQYALLFAEPFFLFHTSIADGTTYFIWIQKYVTARLNNKNPKWRSRKHVTFHFPPENTLKDGQARIEAIMTRFAARTQALEYLSAFDWLETHWEFFHLGEKNLIEPCLHTLERMRKCDRFLAAYVQFQQFRPDFIRARKCLEALAKKSKTLDTADPAIIRLKASFEKHLHKLRFLKKLFLDEDGLDQFAAEMSDASPY
jgi:hypothetical protein